MLARKWSKGNPCTLSVGWQIGDTSVETSIEVSQKIENSRNSTSGYLYKNQSDSSHFLQSPRELWAASIAPISAFLLFLLSCSPDLHTFRCFYAQISQTSFYVRLHIFCRVVVVNFVGISRGEMKGSPQATKILSSFCYK